MVCQCDARIGSRASRTASFVYNMITSVPCMCAHHMAGATMPPLPIHFLPNTHTLYICLPSTSKVELITSPHPCRIDLIWHRHTHITHKHICVCTLPHSCIGIPPPPPDSMLQSSQPLWHILLCVGAPKHTHQRARQQFNPSTCTISSSGRTRGD